MRTFLLLLIVSAMFGCDSTDSASGDRFILADLNGSWESPPGEFSDLYEGEVRPYRFLVTLDFSTEDCADIAGEFQLDNQWESVWEITDVDCHDWERRNSVTDKIETMLTLSGYRSKGGGGNFLYEYQLAVTPLSLFLEAKHSDFSVSLFRTQS